MVNVCRSGKKLQENGLKLAGRNGM